MTPGEEAAFDKKAEKHFKGHPELPNGRDFRFNHQFDKKEDENYRQNFDKVFPNAPGVGL